MSLASNTAVTWKNERGWEGYFSEQEGLCGCRCGTGRQQNTTPRGEVGKERQPDTHSPKECDRESEEAEEGFTLMDFQPRGIKQDGSTDPAETRSAVRGEGSSCTNCPESRRDGKPQSICGEVSGLCLLTHSILQPRLLFSHWSTSPVRALGAAVQAGGSLLHGEVPRINHQDKLQGNV